MADHSALRDGDPGMLLGILALHDLARTQTPGARSTTYKADASACKVKVVPVREVFSSSTTCRATSGPMFLGLAATRACGWRILLNAPFFARTYGWDPARYGIIQGSILLILAPIGSLAGGFPAEWFAEQGRDDANLRVVFIATALHRCHLPSPMRVHAESLSRHRVLRDQLHHHLDGSRPRMRRWRSFPMRCAARSLAAFLFCFSMIGIALAPPWLRRSPSTLFEPKRSCATRSRRSISLAPLATIFF